MSGASDRPERAGDTALVCHCNGVTRGDVLRSIARGKRTVQQIAADTAAGASCGSCRRAVSRLLGHKVAGEADDHAGAVCACTELDHGALRDAIVRGSFGSVDEVMQALGWRNQDGCARCRPAINYYLGCANPDYEDD